MFEGYPSRIRLLGVNHPINRWLSREVGTHLGDEVLGGTCDSGGMIGFLDVFKQA